MIFNCSMRRLGRFIVESHGSTGSWPIAFSRSDRVRTVAVDTLGLDQSPKRRRLVLGGPGGIGKKRLAIAYAQHYSNVYESVLWFDTTPETTLKGSFRSMAEAISDVLEPGVLEGEQILIYVHQWLSDPKNTRWLLIYDNYDDPGQFDIDRYYPFGSHGAIIVTTRRPDGVNGRTVRVQPIQDIEESLEIFQTRSGREGVKFGAPFLLPINSIY